MSHERTPRVGGIVLSAGRSSRMGRPKALLPVNGHTFLEQAIAALREGGCEPVVVVVPPTESEKEMGRIGRASGANVVENPRPNAEQIDSLRIGLSKLAADVEAAVVLPVDMPRASNEVVSAVVEAFRDREAVIVRPTHEGRPGHPVVFSRAIWPELAEPDLARGAREVVDRHRAEIEDVPVDEPGVLVDVDTPEDYRRESRPR